MDWAVQNNQYKLMWQIDAHQHFWQYDPARHGWITDEMAAIRHDFLPQQLRSLLLENNIDGVIAVQADQTMEETNFLLRLAEENNFIKGVVGWVDLQAKDIENQLALLQPNKKLKGFRHILQSEPDDDFMLGSAFLKGIKALGKFDFTYDILVYPKHLSYVEKLVRKFGDQPFVIDHLAKPDIKKGGIDQWERNISRIATYPNVYCKLSGMITEADWKHWKKEEIYPYIDAVIEAFDTNRIMFGSDWPVCLVAGPYAEVVDLVRDYIDFFSNDEKNEMLGGNATKFYNL
jgi:L-fuconolactonase